MENFELPVCGRMLNVAQVAHSLGLAQKTVRNWLYLNRIEHFKIGASVRISERTVREILARGHNPV